MNFQIDALLDAQMCEYGTILPISIDLKKPHLAIFGSSGSGKTYASKLLLAKAILHTSAKLLVADYKADLDFSFLENEQHFYRFEQVGKFFDTAEQILQNRQSGKDKSKDFIICYIDEMSAFFTMLEKKERDKRIRQLSLLLMLGRSFNIHIWISQQRPDAEYFGKSRENIHNIILLGSFSKEVLNMLLSDEKDEVERKQSRGQGYLISSGSNSQLIRVPKYSMSKVERKIIEGMYLTSEAGRSE